MRIDILGGHGKVALRLARLLADDGHEVRSVIRNPEHAIEVGATGAIAVVADLEHLDIPGMAELIDGADAVVWSAGAGGGSPERTVAVDREAAIRSMAAARLAKVDRYLMVSYFGAGPDHGVPAGEGFHTYAEAKTVADATLRSSALDWTLLAPSGLTLDPGTGRIDVPGPGGRSATVSRDDVAAVAAAALAEPRTVHRTIRFNAGEVPIAEALASLPTDPLDP